MVSPIFLFLFYNFVKNYFIMRNFESWETQDLEMTFGLKRVKNMILLNDWLASTTHYDETSNQHIQKLRDRIYDFSDYWNEDELKMLCISPILEIVDYSSDKYGIFTQRPLNATIKGIELGGRVDFMLAVGKQKPVQPYFFIHEYKQETKKGSSDPKGQLLSELITAQYRNEVNFPLYGCYVIGRYWYFAILDGNEYAVSNSFNASDDDIYKIIAILRQVKVYIEKIINKA
jgi:hypothetical protein